MKEIRVPFAKIAGRMSGHIERCMFGAGIDKRKPHRRLKDGDALIIQQEDEFALEPDGRLLLRVCEAAIKLLKPPYRPMASIDPQVRADWQNLREAVLASGCDIGEELT